MKKILTFCFIIGFVFGLNAQNNISTVYQSTGKLGSGGNRAVTCPENAVYAHQINYQTGFTSWTGTDFTVLDQIESTPGTPISQVVFYGVIESGSPDRNFAINFYSDNAGSPGTLIASYNQAITGVFTGENLYMNDYPIYAYTFTFPSSITFVAGDWISVRADGSDYWYWLSASGGDNCVTQNPIGVRCDYGDVAFCLIGGAETPVAPWALGIGIALIAAFVIVRYRRIV
jgi:hypothetical protein